MGPNEMTLSHLLLAAYIVEWEGGPCPAWKSGRGGRVWGSGSRGAALLSRRASSDRWGGGHWATQVRGALCHVAVS